jgi:phosphoglycerate kinase
MTQSNPTLAAIKSIRDLPLKNKNVFLRLDLNVPLSEPDAQGIRRVEDDSRIQEALPTIRHAVEQGGKVIIASHLGRPDGTVKPEYSLEPVASHLAELLKEDVTLADDCVGEGIYMMIQSLKPGQILMLENLRFHKGEEGNDPEFVRKLATFTEVYINDAFGTSHRKHASTFGLPGICQVRGMGFLIEKEVHALEKILEDAPKPFYAILGGSKVTDKIKTIESLMRRVNGICIGGAMAHAFWAVQGDSVPAGAKQPSPADIEAARAVMEAARKKEMPLLLPSDTVEGFDIGPKTVQRFAEFLGDAKTVFWNGPLGWFEKPQYSKGTFEVAKALAAVPAFKVVGGGDTVSAVKQSGYATHFEHLSTGGGAVLEYLENEGLPGIDALKNYSKAPIR